MKSQAIQLTSNQATSKIHTSSISPDEFLTTHELMKLLKIKHRQTIYSLIKEGMPAILVGKNYRFIKQDVINYFKQNGGVSDKTV